MSKAKAGLRGMNATQKRIHASTIHEHMVGNPHFPSPSPTMAEFAQAIQELEQANLAALDRGRLAMAARNRAEEKISSMIARLVGYVNIICQGDTVKILSSGFRLAKTPEPISALQAPQHAKVRRTAYPSQLELSWESVPGAVAYHAEKEVLDGSGQGNWLHVGFSTRPKLVVDGCRTDEHHTFRVCAMGTKVQSPHTEVLYIHAA
jgi:hypothetical protein